MNSRVDVIVPCYKYGKFIQCCVESVLLQIGPSVRVLIIDDASPDNTAEIAAELASRDSRVTLLRHTTNKGHIATYNEGLEWVSGDYLMILSADDYLLPGALDRAARLMDSYPRVTFTFGAAVVLHSDGTEHLEESLPCRNASRILERTQFIARSGGSNIVFTPTAVVRTESQKAVGFYRPELPHCADMELWLRLAAHGSVGYIKAAQGVYRRHRDNMSLAYMEEWLPDIRERQAALNSFFSSNGIGVSGVAHLRRRATYLLSCTAVACASAAYEAGDLDASHNLVVFARQTCPRVIKSVKWAKFVLKRTIGLRFTRVLRSVLGKPRPNQQDSNAAREHLIRA